MDTLSICLGHLGHPGHIGHISHLSYPSRSRLAGSSRPAFQHMPQTNTCDQDVRVCFADSSQTVF